MAARMTQELFDSYKDIIDRVPLSVLQGIFKEHDLLAGRSSEATFEKVEEMLEQGNPTKLASLQRIADWYFNDYMLHGEKAVFFYHIEEAEATNLIDALLNLQLEENIYSTQYPLAIQPEHINKEDLNTYLIRTTSYADGVTLTFSTIRKYTQRINVPRNKLTEDALIEYSNIEEFIAVNRIYRQFFDYVVIYPSGLIELRIDNPVVDNGRPMPVKERQLAFVSIYKKFQQLASELFGRAWVFPEALNLLDKVNELYHSTQGYVRLIAFTTNNSGAKEIKADSKNARDCCRSDAYNQGGTAAVNGDINPYRIHIRWNMGSNHYPELRILGTVHSLERLRHPINEAIIHRTVLKSEYDFVRDLILGG